jgi:hypothetical protein
MDLALRFLDPATTGKRERALGKVEGGEETLAFGA